jgi:hypothetical protein
LFEWLRQNQPDALKKIIPISGDVSLPDLGISFSDMQELVANVSVVFHSAARVKFDDDLRSAINSNVKGPKRVATFCRQLKDLKVKFRKIFFSFLFKTKLNLASIKLRHWFMSPPLTTTWKKKI